MSYSDKVVFGNYTVDGHYPYIKTGRYFVVTNSTPYGTSRGSVGVTFGNSVYNMNITRYGYQSSELVEENNVGIKLPTPTKLFVSVDVIGATNFQAAIIQYKYWKRPTDANQ